MLLEKPRFTLHVQGLCATPSHSKQQRYKMFKCVVHGRGASIRIQSNDQCANILSHQFNFLSGCMRTWHRSLRHSGDFTNAFVLLHQYCKVFIFRHIKYLFQENFVLITFIYCNVICLSTDFFLFFNSKEEKKMKGEISDTKYDKIETKP